MGKQTMKQAARLAASQVQAKPVNVGSAVNVGSSAVQTGG
jgi:hypothetical protein